MCPVGQSGKQKPLYIVQIERDLILENGYKHVVRARGERERKKGMSPRDEQAATTTPPGALQLRVLPESYCVACVNSTFREGAPRG